MSNLVFLAVLACMLVSWVESAASNEHQCSEQKKALVKLFINTHRNQTGHWQTQIGFSPRNGMATLNQSGAWALDIEQSSTTTTCDIDEDIHIMATITQVPESSRPAKAIPADYELFPGVGYYKFHSDSVIWARARQVCAEEGTNLVIVNTENEANVLKQIFMRWPKEKLPNFDAYNSIWVGVYEQGVNGQYFTIFGNPLNSTGFQRWHPGRPSETGTDECVVITRTTAGLIDLDCFRRAPFVCELQS